MGCRKGHLHDQVLILALSFPARSSKSETLRDGCSAYQQFVCVWVTLHNFLTRYITFGLKNGNVFILNTIGVFGFVLRLIWSRKLR
jgi:hypothetical protein